MRPDPKIVVAAGYDRLGPAFSAWSAAGSGEVRAWFRGEVLGRLGEGSRLVELGCGPGTDAAELSAGRRYVGVDLSRVQLSIARSRVPGATFLRGDFTSLAFRPSVLDGVVAFYVFMHVPMFFSGRSRRTNERLLRETGFDLEMSEVRREVEPRYGPTDFHWVIAKKPQSLAE